jgi:carbamoyltransferase
VLPAQKGDSMVILGLNAYHGDSSAAIIVDGKLIAAIEEERICRIKHWAGFPSESIKWCLSYAGLEIKDVDYVAVSRNPWAMMHKKLLRVELHFHRMSFLKHRLQNYAKIGNIKHELAKLFETESSKLKARVVNIEHHCAHAASGFFVSPFENALVVSVDSFGDFASSMVGVGSRNHIRVISRIEFPHSLGLFYTAMTQFLGFWNYGDEYKVMGLSANGEPEYHDLFKKIVKIKDDGRFELDTDYFLHTSQGVDMSWNNLKPLIKKLFSSHMERLLGPARQEGEELSKRFQNMAASIQQIYEDAFFNILSHSYDGTRLDNLVLTGGCAQNSLANGKIYERTNFKNIYVPPAAHDGGGAIGAAFYFWNHIKNNPRVFHMKSPYWGPQFESSCIIPLLAAKKIAYLELSDDRLFLKVANDIASGKVVGWFQGRTEWGPRALGNRSILADPRSREMQDILNARIKRREWFRPFAPAILEEETLSWFKHAQPTPFMEKVYQIRKGKEPLIPAVCHVDGTGRLQTVNQDINPRFYKLIQHFFKITQVPIILNTSFNENEPIVNTPEEALECFLRTKMDVLVLNNLYVVRK